MEGLGACICAGCKGGLPEDGRSMEWLDALLMVLQCEKETGSMNARNLLPVKASERGFEGPQKIEADLCASALRFDIGGDRAQLAQLLDRGDTSARHDLQRFRAEVRQTRDRSLCAHVVRA